MILELFLISTIGFLVFLALHVAIWRIRPSNTPRILLLALLGEVGIAVSLGLLYLRQGFELEAAFSVLCFGTFYVVLYLFIYAGISRSVSITFMSRLLQGRHKPLSFETLSQEYIASNRFEERLVLLHQSHFVDVSGKTIQLTSKGSGCARVIQALSTVFSEGLEG